MLNHETGVAMYKSVFLLILFVLVGLSVLVSNRDATVNAQAGHGERGVEREKVLTLLLSGTAIIPASLTTVGGFAVFASYDPATGKEPWVTDGTKLLKDIWPGTEGSRIGISIGGEFFVPFEERVYFFADDGVNGRELWRTDGTEEGTELFMEFAPGPDSSRGEVRVSGTHSSINSRDRTKKMYIAITAPAGDEIWVYE